MGRLILLAGVALLGAAPSRLLAESPAEGQWPQFRGPAGRAVAADERSYPIHFGPSQHLRWKTPLPRGLSCPCIWNERIFITGFDKDKQRLETFCLNRATGAILWQRTCPAAKIEKFFASNSPATPTPTTDGERVYVYFGSFGLLAYDFAGKECWKKPLPTPALEFGTGTSPVLAGENLLLTLPGREGHLLAVRRATGETVWKTVRPRTGIGYATPVLRDGEVLVVGSQGVTAFDLKDGSERWYRGGLTGGGIPTPALGEGLIFLVAHFPGGDPDDRLHLPAFDDLLKRFDKNHDGLLAQDEVPGEMVLFDRGSKIPDENITMSDYFPIADKNHDGKLDREEWKQLGESIAKRESSMLAFRAEGRGDLGGVPVAWKEKRALPEVPSPLYWKGYLYLIKDGGVASCFEARTGKLMYRQRVGAGGFYYASPIAAADKIYVASVPGVVSVLQAGPTFRVLARNDLGETIMATPALMDGTLYARTESHLFAFGE